MLSDRCFWGLPRTGRIDLGMPANHDFALAFVPEGAGVVEFAGS